MIEKSGVPTVKDLQKIVPYIKRKRKGAVAIIECFQEIPCNPCETTCPKEAIKVGEDINALPQFDAEKCTGCGICIANCPGLAVFVINLDYSKEEALVMLPYEFLPLPKVGEIVKGLDRSGKSCCPAKVVRVLNTKAQDRTPIISLAVPKGMEMKVRFFRRRKVCEKQYSV
ncbi:MAG: 4Fe-4S binding protein [Candidatus Edwardsbacteria bacterium]